MWKRLFWSRYMTWLRKLLGANKPKISIEEILDATGGPAKIPHGTYTSFSGVDVKVYFEDNEGNFLCVPEVQAVSCEHDPFNEKVQGTLISLLFDGDTLAYLPFKPKAMLLVACNEYGTLCYTKFKDFEFTQKSWGMSIDDICCSIRTDFKAVTCTPWKRLSDIRRYEDWEENLPEQIQERLRTYG